MAFAACSTRRRARSRPTASTSIQFDEPAFNVYMDEVDGLGHRGAAPRHRGAQLHHRRPHLLRLRHQGQHRLEGDARRRVAPVRGGLSRRWPRAASSRCRSSAATPRCRLSLLALLNGKDVQVGVIDVASDEIETPEQVAAVIARGDEARAPRSASSPAPIAAWRRCGATSRWPSSRRSARARSWRGKNSVELCRRPPSWRPATSWPGSSWSARSRRAL